MERFEKLKCLRAAVNWKIVKERHDLLNQLYDLTSDWRVGLPELRDVFCPQEIDWLLSEAAKNLYHYDQQCEFIEFVARTGYQDEPKFGENGKLQRLHRTTAVHHAAKFSNNYVLLDLFEIYNKFHVNYVDESGLTHFHVACEFGLDDVVKKFLDLGEDPNCLVPKTSYSPLHLAMISNEDTTKVVELLLRRGADPNLANIRGWTPVHIMAFTGYDNEDLANFFNICDDLRRTVQIDAQDRSGATPLHLASEWCSNKEVAEFLLRRGADPYLARKDGSTALHIISKRTDDDDDLLKMFCRRYYEDHHTLRLDVQDKSGNTPLHKAVESGNTKLVDLMLSHGADPNLTNGEGSTPLHMICSRDDDGLAYLFFEICDDKQLSVQIDAQNKSGNTPLHEALISRNQKVVELLLRRGANPNSVNEEGQIPLHIICKRTSSKEELLAMFPRLAQLDVMDTWGRTPLQWAVENLVPRVVDILLDHGADLSSFVFPTASDFDERFNRRAFSGIYTNYKLRMASSLLVIAENLEKRGYEFNRSEALTIMRFFAKHDLFEKSSKLDEFWYNNEEFVSLAKRLQIRSSLSLYQWSRLTPEEEGKLLTYENYFKWSEFDDVSILPEGVREACQMHLCEMMSRGFFRRWALDAFWKLIHHRLPLECSEMVLSNLMNEDLYHIFLAAEGQSL